MEYLEGLNDSQRAAVLQTEGPVMIIAGAGSGKTRVLTYRIIHLLEKGIDPFNILSLTFTNKASKEMRERIQALIGSEARNIWMGTFHSVFARILRSEASLLGYPSNFTIYDTTDTKSLIKSIVKEMNLDDKLYKPNAVLNRISTAKNNLVSAQQYSQNGNLIADDEYANRPLISKIYKTYQERLFKSDAMDFDDLLFNTSILLRDHPEVLLKYQHKFKYVMVDEFQDTNLAQYYITKKLSAVHRNIAVVGDDAQSIYAFRGASIQNILNFEKDYEELKVFKLEQNYRSTDNIVQAANSIIKHNSKQLEKKVWTSNEEGDLIRVFHNYSDSEESKRIANDIFEKKHQESIPYESFAILYRTNAQSRSLEEALRRLNIPYQIYGGLSFYQRKEIKDLIAYLRLTVNPNDEEALKRIINYPRRGIGDGSVAKLFVYANEKNISIWEALQSPSQYISGRIAGGIENFSILIKSFIIESQSKDAYSVATHIAKTTGILRELHSDKSVEGLARYENIQELLNGVKEFVDNPENEDKTLGKFLQEVSLLTNADQNSELSDFVTLMTIHSSKGLEFKHTYVAGMEEELFPSLMMLESREDLEEERRLFYVAVTRAESSVTLSYALSRYRFGKLKNCEPSRFLQEIEPKYLDYQKRSAPQQKERSFGGYGSNKSKLSSGYGEKSISTKQSSSYGSLLDGLKKKDTYKSTISSTKTNTRSFSADDTSLLTEGMVIEHQKFGLGKVILIENKGQGRKAKVLFDKFGEKTLLLSFAKLKIHS